MTRYSSSCFAVAATILLSLGCGGSTDEGGGGSGGTAGSAGSGGTAGSAGSGAGTLAGTWEVRGTRYGTGETTGLISLSGQLFSIQTDGGGVNGILKSDGSFEVMVADTIPPSPWSPELPANGTLLATRTSPGSFNEGAFPLDLSGSWWINDTTNPSPMRGCIWKLGADSFDASCKDSRRFEWMPDFTNGSGMCKRTSVLSSMFGDFGGEWKCTTTPANGACTFRFEGATISSNCSNAPRLDGTMTITFNGDIASGQTSTGFEFSAKRN